MLCPGKKAFIKDVKDLDPTVFRQLVDRRARKLVDPMIEPTSTKTARRRLEKALEKIHFDPNFLPARFLRDGWRRARAVCRVRASNGNLGTGFLVTRNAVMTNNHVIKSSRVAEGSVAEFDFEAGENRRVVMLRPARLFITNEDLDFTIVSCDEVPSAEPIPLLRNPATITRNERVSIVQHPAGRLKEVALHDNRVIRVLDKVIRYRTDTEPGSSGSPVFNSDWELVALHHAGVSEQGGAATNEGIRISAIVAHLLRRFHEGTESGDAINELLARVTDTSPFLGFFDFFGIGELSDLEVEVPDYRGTVDFGDIGVWNIEHFNNRVSDDRVRDVADVVERLSMDVLGLVEVQQGAMERLVAELRQRGSAMDFELLDVPRYAQDLAVLFDKNTTTVKLRPDISRRHKKRLDARTDSGSAFPRHPLFAECAIASDNGHVVPFLMIVVHLKAFGDSQSRARRQLASEILAEIIDDLREREGIPVVLGGDFNERLDTDVLAAIKSSPDLLSMTADDATNDAVSYVGGSYRSLIDHIVVSKDAQLGEIQGDDTAIVRLDQTIRDFSDRVSDHVPLVFRVVLRGEPIDAEPLTAQRRQA